MAIEISLGGPSGGLKDYADVANVIVASFALLTAFLSIWLSRETLVTQKHHNQLSVRPIPYLALSKVGGLSVILENHGFGPFQITDVNIIGGAEGKWNLVDYIPSSTPPGVAVHWITGLKRRTVKADGSIEILNISATWDGEDVSFYLKQCASQIGKLQIDLEYTDIYNRKFEKYSKNLKWFVRD
jgi:hypothetical protein